MGYQTGVRFWVTQREERSENGKIIVLNVKEENRNPRPWCVSCTL